MTTAVRDLTVGEVAEQAGVSESAVRFYERHGLVTAARTPGNQRRFAESAPCLIKVAKVAQRVGLSVKEIAALFAVLPEEPAHEDWGRIATTLVVEAQARVDALRAALDDLGSGARLCELA
jgi:MerR family transcriptional regulator, redox-sensitive transcriptional activator SoxR